MKHLLIEFVSLHPVFTVVVIAVMLVLMMFLIYDACILGGSKLGVFFFIFLFVSILFGRGLLVAATTPLNEEALTSLIEDGTIDGCSIDYFRNHSPIKFLFYKIKGNSITYSGVYIAKEKCKQERRQADYESMVNKVFSEKFE